MLRKKIKIKSPIFPPIKFPPQFLTEYNWNVPVKTEIQEKDFPPLIEILCSSVYDYYIPSVETCQINVTFVIKIRRHFVLWIEYVQDESSGCSTAFCGQIFVSIFVSFETLLIWFVTIFVPCQFMSIHVMLNHL